MLVQSVELVQTLVLQELSLSNVISTTKKEGRRKMPFFYACKLSVFCLMFCDSFLVLLGEAHVPNGLYRIDDEAT